MKKLIILPYLVLFFLILSTRIGWAQPCSEFTTIPEAKELKEGITKISFSFRVNEISDTYSISNTNGSSICYVSGDIKPDSNGFLTPIPIILRPESTSLFQPGKHILTVTRIQARGTPYCTLPYEIIKNTPDCTLRLSSTGNPGFTPSDTIYIEGSNIPDPLGGSFFLSINPGRQTVNVGINNGTLNKTSLGIFNSNTYAVTLFMSSNPPKPICSTTFTIKTSGGTSGGTSPGMINQITECDYDGTKGIITALGCIPIQDPTKFVGWILKIAIGLGGGIAFLLIVFGAFQVITSSGNPEAVKKGTEMITAAISGLLFILFSLFLLKLIGVNILNIPGFGAK